MYLLNLTLYSRIKFIFKNQSYGFFIHEIIFNKVNTDLHVLFTHLRSPSSLTLIQTKAPT